VYFRESELREFATQATQDGAFATLRKDATTAYGPFDVFVSHSVRDARVVLGIRQMLESQGLKVYVDWIDDKQMDRSSVSPATADRLRRRMTESRSLIYATSRAASKSRWMPWELGYFDGRKGPDQVAILPIESDSTVGFVGQEYIGLYKVIEKVLDGDSLRAFAVQNDQKRAQLLKSFATGSGQFYGLR